MQLRAFVKTKFPGGTLPRGPPPNFAPRALVLNASGVQSYNKCIGQILGMDPAMGVFNSNRSRGSLQKGKPSLSKHAIIEIV